MVRGGERVLIHPFQAEHNALYADFLRDLSPGDLRLRSFERVAELTAVEEDKLTRLDYGREMAFLTPDEIRATYLASCV